jgi:hypothetical protein
MVPLEAQLKAQEQDLLDTDLMAEMHRSQVTVAQEAAEDQEQREQMERVMAISQQKAEAQAEQVIMVNLQLFQQLHLSCHQIGKQQQHLEELQEVEELLQILVLHKELQEQAELVEVEEDLTLQLEDSMGILELTLQVRAAVLVDQVEMV